MKTLRIYGDSFGAPSAADTKCWADILAAKLNVPVVNKAISGSGTEYSIKQLISDVSIIEDNDIVIFVTSTPGRLHFQKQISDPHTASLYLRDPVGKQHQWYWDNKKHIEWWMVNADQRLLDLNHEAYLHLIKDIAVSKPNATFIILANSDHRVHIPSIEPKNFLRCDTYLHEISSREMADPANTYFKWTEHTTYDLRVNHLTIPNLNTLANLLEESITTLSVDNITYDKFKSRFLVPVRVKKEYLDYVEQGYLYQSEWFSSLVK
jgi:hypothetical protein